MPKPTPPAVKAAWIIYPLVLFAFFLLWLYVPEVTQLLKTQMSDRMGKGMSEALLGVMFFLHTLAIAFFLTNSIANLLISEKHWAGINFMFTAALFLVYYFAWFKVKGIAFATAISSIVALLLLISGKRSDPLGIR
jgi:hypothetical protein